MTLPRHRMALWPELRRQVLDAIRSVGVPKAWAERAVEAWEFGAPMVPCTWHRDHVATCPSCVWVGVFALLDQFQTLLSKSMGDG